MFNMPFEAYERVFQTNTMQNIRMYHTGCLQRDHGRAFEQTKDMRSQKSIASAEPCAACCAPAGLSDRLEIARDCTAEGGIGKLERIGELMCEWLRSPGLFDQYSKYCANITVAKHTLQTLLEQLKSQNKHALEGYLRTSEQFKEIRRQTLADLLDLPRRRLQRYPLLLSAILKHTSEYDPDYAHLQTAIKLAEKGIRYVDSAMKETDGARIVAIQNSLDFSHANSWQKVNLVEDGEGLLLETEARLLKDNKQCHLYLFAHLLILTKESKHNAGKQQVMGRPIRLQNLEVCKGEDIAGKLPMKTKETGGEVDSTFLLEIKNDDPALCKTAKHSTRKGAVGMRRGNSNPKSGKSYVVQFMSDKERNEWLDMIVEFKKRNAVNPISFV